ncbi:MAG: carboxypeptidase-like regulatory domain-containing protein, partial [Prevotellaceae bacterium]|nr:carboxypeptidase-like regulatory domain-containing protein [Prevotellaceae bacterium]
MKKKTFLLLLVWLVTVHYAAYTQTRVGATHTHSYEQGRVTGTVRDERGEPLPGASVVVKGTTTSAV